jgi:hypothetical protein
VLLRSIHVSILQEPLLQLTAGTSCFTHNAAPTEGTFVNISNFSRASQFQKVVPPAFCSIRATTPSAHLNNSSDYHRSSTALLTSRMQRDSRESSGSTGAPRPQPLDTDHAALHSRNTSDPVTPGVHLSGQSAYIDVTSSEHNTDLPFDPETATPGPQWNANSYFAPRGTPASRPDSPSELTKGAKTAEELLRRLSLAHDPSMKKDLADVDPRAAHPNLHLSGGIISAAFCVPYNIGFAPDLEWVRLMMLLPT